MGPISLKETMAPSGVDRMFVIIRPEITLEAASIITLWEGEGFPV